MTGAPATLELPLLPLKNVVLFPHMIVPLYVGRERSIAALEAAMAHGKQIFLCTQRRADCEEPQEADLHRVGVLARVVQMLKLPDATIKVLIEGTTRAVIERFTPSNSHLKVEVAVLEEELQPSPELASLMRGVVALFDRYVELDKKVPPEVNLTVRGVEDAGRLADIVAANLSVAVTDKQDLLETFQMNARLEKLTGMLNREIEILDMDRSIRQRVRQQIDRRQKEFYLKEQMRVIQEELGSDETQMSELDELREKVRCLELAEAIEDRLLKDVDRLERMPPGSPEISVLHNYLDLVVSLPWHESSEDVTDLRAAEKVLDEDHHGLQKIKERILEFLAVRQLTKSPRGPILCFIGPPGVGKTSLGRSIARALGRKFVRASLGGVSDEAEIRGHRRTYVGSMPGRIIKGLREAGTRNPVFLLDEIDKMSSDFRGDPGSAMLEVLDPEQNKHFSDHYLEIPFDLSEVLFITTANVYYSIPRPLLDRMEVINLAGYTSEEKLVIGRDFLVPKQLKEHGLTDKNIDIPRAALTTMISRYTSEAGVRNLERSIATVCRKVAREVVSGKTRRMVLSATRLEDLLGPPRFKPEEGHKEPLIGVANGLAWTEVGGVLLTIEVITMPGKGNLNMTGQLGDVMQESARAALSYARSNAEALGIPVDFREKLDLHIHIPKGAIPKDGPSAGISMALAIISALSQRPIRSDVALTGEITLRGRVLPIGGLKEKVLAAHRIGIKTILLPEDNQPDLVDIPPDIRKRLTFKFVKTMDEVIAEALLPKSDTVAVPAAADGPQLEEIAAANADELPSSPPASQPTL
ncbi:MAG TPA: endopeptidase La [Candidatus Dormibacteraeota bacterium]|nr:endopeptidase La [Candidatus Dormibacteraeota bacterium]